MHVRREGTERRAEAGGLEHSSQHLLLCSAVGVASRAGQSRHGPDMKWGRAEHPSLPPPHHRHRFNIESPADHRKVSRPQQRQSALGRAGCCGCVMAPLPHGQVPLPGPGRLSQGLCAFLSCHTDLCGGKTALPFLRACHSLVDGFSRESKTTEKLAGDK